LILGAGAALLAVPAPVALALPDHATFDIVLGQPRATLRRQNSTEDRGLSNPAAVAIDRKHSPAHLYVADSGNGRVLAWRDLAQFKSGAPADLILGQPDTVSGGRASPDAAAVGLPAGLAVDAEGTLYVSDAAFGRILGFHWPFDPQKSLAERTSPDVLIGQSDLIERARPCNGASFSSPGSAAADTLCGPAGLAFDQDGNLFAADRGNHRVVVFRAPIAARGAQASLVFGQDTLSGLSLCNRNASPTAPNERMLCGPQAVFFAPGLSGGPAQLYVADTDNNRVLVYDDPLRNQSASRVLGQPSLSQNPPGAATDRLNRPAAVTVDGDGLVWVSDTGNHRLLGFSAPLPAAASAASYVLGQADGNGNLPNQGTGKTRTPLPSAFTLFSPRGLLLDGQGRLLCADSGNHRVLLYESPRKNAWASLVLGQLDMMHGAENRTKAQGLANPVGIAVDRPDPAGRPGEAIHVYVADSANSRVLGWQDLTALRNGRPADVVLGQRNFLDAACNMGRGTGAQGLCYPRGVAVDKNGDVWVADTWNHRVLRFPRPFAPANRDKLPQTADLVLGQQSLLSGLHNGTGVPTPSARTLYSPAAVAVDDKGVVWVADRDNHRVLGFAPPYAIGMPAARVLAGFERTEDQAGCPSVNNGGYVCAPSGLALDASGNLWVADRDNNRVALYRTTPPSDTSPLLSPVPIAVLGQPNVVAGAPNGGAPEMPTRKTLRGPEGVSVELREGSDGKPAAVAIVVADSGNNRVLVYEPISVGFQPDATAVLGQAGYETRAPNRDEAAVEAPANVAAGLYGPGAVLAVPEGLLIADTGNSGEYTLRRGDLEPQPGSSGNNRVILIKGPLFPPDPVDGGGEVPDMASSDLSSPPTDQPKGCSCQVGAQPASQAMAAVPGVLLLGALGALLRRPGRRQRRS
jgi:sugar lactone lactonase YvrE